MASGSRRLDPRGRLVPMAELLLTHPENFGTLGRLREIQWISTLSLLYPRYRSLEGHSFFDLKGNFRILFRTLSFPISSMALRAPTLRGFLSVSGMIRKSSISVLVSSSHRNFNQRYSLTFVRDPCEYTNSRLSVPVSRLVKAVTLKVLNDPLNLGIPGPATIKESINWDKCILIGRLSSAQVNLLSVVRCNCLT